MLLCKRGETPYIVGTTYWISEPFKICALSINELELSPNFIPIGVGPTIRGRTLIGQKFGDVPFKEMTFSFSV